MFRAEVTIDLDIFVFCDHRADLFIAYEFDGSLDPVQGAAALEAQVLLLDDAEGLVLEKVGKQTCRSASQACLRIELVEFFQMLFDELDVCIRGPRHRLNQESLGENDFVVLHEDLDSHRGIHLF